MLSKGGMEGTGNGAGGGANILRAARAFGGVGGSEGELVSWSGGCWGKGAGRGEFQGKIEFSTS